MSQHRTPFRILCHGCTALAALGLSACSWIPGMDRLTGEEGVFRDRQGDYLEAETIPRTQVPERYDSYIIDDLYVIPELRNPETTAFLDAPRPRPLEGRSDREVVIQRIRERAWVVVDASPSQVWPRIRDYWTAKGVTLAEENPTRGVMETGWFTLEGNSLSKERFRVIVETGFQDDSSEIRLLHASMPQAVPAMELTPWPGTSDNTETEFTVLNEMAGYLADVADLYRASSVSLLAGNISNQGKAALSRGPDNEPLLRLQADYERSWAAVGRALNRAGAEVVSSDEAQGLYEVRFTPGAEAEEEKGFFRSLLTLDRFRDDTPLTHSLRVQLRQTGESVDVQAQALPQAEGEGAALPPAEDPVNALLRAVLVNLA